MNDGKLRIGSRMRRLAVIWPQLLLAFAFPTLTVLAALAFTRCYPFGSRTMLTVDLYHQYAPFVVAFKNKILSGDSLFYSWNDGMGQEYYAAYANYAASPLNLLAVFFDAKTIPIFIGVVTCLRAGLASLFMLFFLSENDNHRVDNITVVFASSYALCGWFISYFWNIMWCDAVVLLPLVMLGLRRLLLDRKCTLYMASLAVLIYSNYYSGFFVCLFLVMFAPVYYLCLFSPDRPKGDKYRLCPGTIFPAAIRFAVSSIIAGCATAVLTLPTYFVLKHCSAIGDEFPKDFNLTNDMFDFLGRLMVAANPNIRDGMANVYSGLVAVILLPLFFLLPKKTGINLRHKIGFGALLVVMYFSFNNRTLNFIWHGLHFPNQIPYRESFLMSFILIFMGFITIRRLRSLGLAKVMGSVGSCAAFLLLYEKFGTGNEGYIQIGVTLLFLIIQGAALRVAGDPKTRKSSFFCETLLTVTMLAELFASATISFGLVANHEGFASYHPYGKNFKPAAAYVRSVEGTDGHKVFERSEIFPNNVCDIQSLYDFKGMSIFSSTARESLVKYMRNFGFHNNGINGLRNAGLTRVTASLIGVRNLLEVDTTQSLPPLFVKEHSDDDITVWGNTDALSVGYMVSDDVLEYNPEEDEENDSNVFEKTNKLIRAMGSDAVYKPLNATAGQSEGIVTTTESGSEFFYTVDNSQKDSWITIDVDDADIGSDVYIYTNCSEGGTAEITVGEESRSFEIRRYQIISLGVFDGTPMSLKVKFSENVKNSVDVYAYQLDRSGYDNMLSYLSDEQFDVRSYNSTSINGTVTAKEDGLLFMTIPYSEGWTAEVDGQPCEITPINDALCGIKLSSGRHEVALRYSPAGFVPGLAASAVAVVLIILSAVLPGVITSYKNRKQASVIVPDEEPVFDEALATEDVLPSGEVSSSDEEQSSEAVIPSEENKEE